MSGDAIESPEYLADDAISADPRDTEWFCKSTRIEARATGDIRIDHDPMAFAIGPIPLRPLRAEHGDDLYTEGSGHVHRTTVVADEQVTLFEHGEEVPQRQRRVCDLN